MRKMEEAVARADCIVALMTPAYLKGPFAQAEFRAAMAYAMRGGTTRVVMVVVEDCEIPRLYDNHIRLRLG